MKIDLKIKEVKHLLDSKEPKEIGAKPENFISIDIISGTIDKEISEILSKIKEDPALSDYVERNSAEVIAGNVLMHRYILAKGL